jgi:hypothetical protein
VLKHLFPKVGENITAFCEEQKSCVYMASSYGYKCGSFIAVFADAVLPICCTIQADSFLVRSLQCSTILHFVFFSAHLLVPFLDGIKPEGTFSLT